MQMIGWKRKAAFFRFCCIGRMKPLLKSGTSLVPSIFAAACAIALSSASADPILFDSNSPGLQFTGTAGSDANYVYVPSSSSAYTDDLIIPAGNYLVSAFRTTGVGGTAYNLAFGNVNAIRDYALGGGGDETVTFLGYYLSTGSGRIGLNDGAPSVARVRNIQFEATSNVYFDENTAGLSFSGTGTDRFNAGIAAGKQDSLLNSAGYNAIGIAPNASGGALSGTISLVMGQTYQVFVSRQMTLDSDGNNFNLTLNGDLFATVSGNTSSEVANNAFQADSFGFYTATSNSVSVLIDQAGSSYGRLDYVQFTAVPEPSSAALFALGGFAVCAMLRRKKLALRN